MNERLKRQFSDVDIVPYTSVDRFLSVTILVVVVLNLAAVLIAMIWGS